MVHQSTPAVEASCTRRSVSAATGLPRSFFRNNGQGRLTLSAVFLFPAFAAAAAGRAVFRRAAAALAILRRHLAVDLAECLGNCLLYTSVDDYPYGGGHGAVLQADPLYRCWCHVCDEAGAPVHTIYLSPAGHVFDQSDARRLAKMDNLVFVCGHYEGIDQRFIDECVDEELSIGDFVVTGGEIPAMAITDAVCRLVPGVLSDAACFEDESHWAGTLEYPQYSRPAEWHGLRVPDKMCIRDRKCSCLSKEHFAILCEIIDRYIFAVSM